MIALPMEPLETNAAQLLGIDSSRLLLARWDPSAPPEGDYQIWPNLEPFAPGRAYWVKLFADATVNLQGLLPPENQQFLLPVALGWNMIGSPRRQSVPLANLQVQVGSDDPISLQEAISQGFLQQVIYHYVPGAGYEQADTLEPYEGYWVRCLLPGGLRLIFPAL